VLEHDFAAILMDVQMPGMDGFETAERIRERDRSRHTPILFLTAFQSTDAEIRRAYTLGAVDFLSKPIVPAVLRAKVGVFVELFVTTEKVRRQAVRLVATQRREHQRALAEQKRQWEVERLREEAAREKRAAEALAQKAEELTRSIRERVRAEEELRHRATQQAVVAEVGQRALAGAEPTDLLDAAASAVARGMGVEFSRVMELCPKGDRLEMRAGFGWRDEIDVRAESSGAGDSISGFTLRSGGPVRVESLRDETRFVPPEGLLAHGVESALCVPIGGRKGPFGTLGVFTSAPRGFPPDDVNFLQAMANVLAAAIERWRNEHELAAVRDQLQTQLADLTQLHSLSEKLSNSLELPEVLKTVLSAVIGLQGTDRGVLMLYDRERDAMTTAAGVGFAPDELDDLAAQAPDPGAGAGAAAAGAGFTAVISGSIVVEDAADDPVLAPHLAAAGRAGYRVVCSTPLLTRGGALVGSIATYFHHPYQPSDRETRMVELYARQAAEVIDNARLYREIREADRRKGEFLAMLGHELRNPLAPVMNALHVIRQAGDVSEEVGEARDVAERQVRHLARLVDDLLDVSRINSGKIELRKGRVDLREAVARAVETARPLIESRRHELTVELPPHPLTLSADKARLEQVLSNLLNNAAKYTEPGGTIRLEVVREGDEAVARIRDDGIGIEPRLLPRVFELFTQADRSLDRSQGGLGIGLTLVRRLVELHGGLVSAHSEGIGRGSEFTVRLPADPADAPDGAPSASLGRTAAKGARAGAGAGSGPPRRVLLVDDNVDGAVILARLLRAGGHRGDRAHDGRTALELAGATCPDVVLLDIGLPEMDGYEVATRLRGMEGLQRATLVALTGYGQEEDRRRSTAAGFDHHLVKPVDPDAIRDLLDAHDPAPEDAPQPTGGPHLRP
jgi:signal transduction histidine kinase/DNA-binding response OmpR family regulator